MVRNPFGRVYSAWESKVLVGDPARLDRFGEPGAGDVVVDGQLDVRATVRRLRGRARDRGPRSGSPTATCGPSTRSCTSTRSPTPGSVRLEELDRFVPELRAHLVADGAPDPGELVHANSGLGIDWRDAYDEGSVAVVAALYADDFTRLGYPTDLVPGTGAASLPPVAVRLLDGLRRRNRRIAQLLAVNA